jgi:hypothetical protein
LSENSLAAALVLVFSPRPLQSAGCVEFGCIDLGGKICFDSMESDWNNIKLNLVLQHNAQLRYTAMFNLQHTTVQHIQLLNIHSAVLSANWVTVAVKYLKTDTLVYCGCLIPKDKFGYCSCLILSNRHICLLWLFNPKEQTNLFTVAV